MAGIAGFIGRNAMILEMRCGNMGRVVHIKTFSIVFHGVTRQAESCTFGTPHFPGNAQQPAKNRQTKHGDKGEYLSASRISDCRASDKYAYYHNAKKDQT